MKIEGLRDTIEWYNQNAEQYTLTTSQKASYEELDTFTKLLPANARILDAGCASGRDVNIFYNRGFEAVGLDLSSGLIKVARKNYPGLEFVEGNMSSLPFFDSSFDGVWASASLIHFEEESDVQKAISEFNRVLKKDGVLYLSVRAQIGDAKTAIVADDLSKHDRFIQYFTKPEIEKILSDGGFKLNSEIIERQSKSKSDVVWLMALARKE